MIVLLVFIVIQRRPWKKARKRVRTHGTWYPPSLFFPSSGGGGSGAGGAHSREPIISNDPGILLQQGHKPAAKSGGSQLEDLLIPGGKRARYSPTTTVSCSHLNSEIFCTFSINKFRFNIYYSI